MDEAKVSRCMNETRSLVDFKSVSERRSNVELMVDILKIASSAAGKTEIVYKANLNFKQAQKYLVFLVRKGLLDNEVSLRERKRYRTTEKGKAFIKRYEETLVLIS